MRSAEKSIDARRKAKGQRTWPNSTANALEGYEVCHQRRGHPLVPNKCPLVRSQGQHTYQACMSIAAKEEPGSTRHKLYTKFDVIQVYSRDPDMLIDVSNAFNIQVKDKVITENFRSLLKNARAKWIEKGRPCPKRVSAKCGNTNKQIRGRKQ